MSVQIIYPFSSPANYIFNPSEISVSGGLASLVSFVDPEIFNEDFASDAGFTYDSGKAEFTSGLVRQSDQTPVSSVLAATYDASVNAKWHKSGSVIGTLNGSPVVSGGKLVCTGAAQKGVFYGISNDGQAAIKFIYTPNYTGAPVSNFNLCGIQEASGNNNRILVTHSPAGNNLRITLTNSSGVNIHLATAIGGPVSFTSGVDVEVELNWDNVAGVIRLFLDGVLHGTLSPGAWTHNTTSARLYVGAMPTIYNLAEASFDDVVFFSSVQHTSGYTPGYSVPDRYTESSVEAPVFTTSFIDFASITNLLDTSTNAPQYTIKVGAANFKYWNGASWVDSDGTFAQSSTITDINTNAASFPSVSGETQVTIRVHFNTNDANQMSVSDANLTMSTNKYPVTNPTIEFNSGFYHEGIDAFSEITTKIGSDEVKYILKKNGNWYYHDGADWVVSDETYTQSNTAAEIEANKATFTTTPIQTFVRAFLHSDDGSTSPSIDSVQVDYNYAGTQPAVIERVSVVGHLFDDDGNPRAGDVVSAILNDDVVFYKTNLMLKRTEKTAIVDDTGKWEMLLEETDNMQAGTKYIFTIDKEKYIRRVPNSGVADFNSLVN